jgi:hypothetical protein
MTANTDREEVKPLVIDMHRQGGMLLCMGAAPSMAESTASIKPAGGAEKAATARLKAFGLRAYGKLSME